MDAFIPIPSFEPLREGAQGGEGREEVRSFSVTAREAS